MKNFLIKPKIVPPLDKDFRPAVLANHAFLAAVRASAKSTPLVIGLERNDGFISVFNTQVFQKDASMAQENLTYVERMVKILLWQRGGWKVIIGGPEDIGKHIKKVYSPNGERRFDVELMERVYERKFTVEVTSPENVPPPREEGTPLGRHLNGCRIGFDAGASDRKVAAVIDGKEVFTEEVVWDPKSQSDPDYHYSHIQDALHSAAKHLPRVNAIGISSAGIYINNRVMVASLFRGVPHDVFEKRIKNIFLDIKKEWGNIPLEVINDGEVTALAGSMSLNVNRVLGIALGSSQAGGYVNKDGNITGWLNELAFAPVDYNPDAPLDEWSGDRGCGVQYFSQVAAIRLAASAGITLDNSHTPAEKLKSIQSLLATQDTRAIEIFETIGCYMGYAVAHYADFYDLEHVLILGRVTSGDGGNIILKKSKEVLQKEFPTLFERIILHLPDESSRRVGQAIAAASLPAL